MQEEKEEEEWGREAEREEGWNLEQGCVSGSHWAMFVPRLSLGDSCWRWDGENKGPSTV